MRYQKPLNEFNFNQQNADLYDDHFAVMRLTFIQSFRQSH
jgi:hypothetical protein